MLQAFLEAPGLESLTSVRKVMASGGSHYTSEHRFRRADGTYADIYACGYVIRDDEEDLPTSRLARQGVLHLPEPHVARRREDAVRDEAPDGVVDRAVGDDAADVDDHAAVVLCLHDRIRDLGGKVRVR